MANGQDFVGLSQGCTGLETTGCWLARRLSAGVTQEGHTRVFFLHLPFAMCVCFFFSFMLDVRLVDVPAGVTQEEGHTGGRSHRISHPPSFCGACLNFSRDKDSAVPFPRRP